MPESHVFDPYSPETLADPYPAYARLREHHPCFHIEAGDYWVLSRYDDVAAALRDHARFSSAQGTGRARATNPNLIDCDPPDHTRLRRLVSRVFVPKAISARRAQIEAIVAGQLDHILQLGSCDLVDDFAAPLPITVIAEMMGVSPQYHADFKRWSDLAMEALAGELSAERAAEVEAGRVEMVQFFKDVVAERRVNPSADTEDDLIATLLSASDDERLSPSEVMAFCVLLLVAGNETTTNLIASTTLAVQSHLDQWQLVLDDRELVPSFVEETLRHDSPVQAFFRTTRCPVDIAGRTIPADAKVMLLFGSANRDGSHFEAPDEFRSTRNPVDHLAFGAGIHICLGAALARLEAGVVAHAFAARVRSVRLQADVVRSTNPLLRGIRHMAVSLRAR